MAARVSYTVQRSGEGAAILKACRDLAAVTTFDRVTGLYAFASLKGARLLTGVMSESPRWPVAVKRWIISIDGGITEPNALRYLLRLRKAEVRVPNAEELLARKLRPIRRFHPKTLFFERKQADFTPSAIMVGSANLTCSGLCFSDEQAISAHARSGALPDGILSGLRELEIVVSGVTVVDSAFIDRYEAIRPTAPSLPEEFEDDRAELILQERPVLPPTTAASLAAASHFWVEIEYVVANRGRLEQGNQIDMQRGSRLFWLWRPIASKELAHRDGGDSLRRTFRPAQPSFRQQLDGQARPTHTWSGRAAFLHRQNTALHA